MDSKLRSYLAVHDADLARRAEMLWEISLQIHVRQTRPDENENGPAHLQMVEQHIYRLLTETGKIGSFDPIELFLLSCAACCHDFDKGLKSALPGAVFHGEGSGQFVVKKADQLVLERNEAIAVDFLSATHNYQGDQYKEKLAELPEAHATRHKPIDLQRLAVVLKVADILHTDSTRVSDLAVDVSKLEGIKRAKHLARRCTNGWHLDGKRTVITAYPQSAEDVTALAGAQEYMKQNEWRAIGEGLRRYGFPHELVFENQARYLALEHQAAGDSATRELPGMDYYHEADAALLGGRERDIAALLNLVITYPASVLVGPSGAGKTSVIHAGLVPMLRKVHGWKIVTTRPDKTNGSFFSARDFGALSGDTFAIACQRARGSADRLLVIFDQFEDVAYFGAFDKDAIVQQIHTATDNNPERRLLLSYRDDVESVMASLWNQLSGSSSGLPRHPFARLKHDGAAKSIRKLLALKNLSLEPEDTVLARIIDDLQSATRREAEMAAPDEIYPPFLQMLIQRLAEVAVGGVVTLEIYQSLAAGIDGPADRAIGQYLERSVDRVLPPVIGPQYARRVLEVLARSTGKKGAADDTRISAEAGVPREDVQKLLENMENLRLIRRIGGGTWEVIHDHLARGIITGLRRERLRFRQARDALESKAQTFRDHGGHLTWGEMHELWLGRDGLPPESLRSDERVVLIIAMMSLEASAAASGEGVRNEWWRTRFVPPEQPVPGWYWFNALTHPELMKMVRTASWDGGVFGKFALLRWCGLLRPDDAMEDVVEVLRVPNERQSDAALAIFKEIALPTDLFLLRQLLLDSDTRVRRAAAAGLGKFGSDTDLPSLVDLLGDDDDATRSSAVRAIARLGSVSFLPTLTEELQTEDWAVREAIAKILGSLGLQEGLPLLEELLRDPNLQVRSAAVVAGGQLGFRGCLPAAIELLEAPDYEIQAAAAKAIMKVSSTDELPLLHDLLKNHDPEVCRLAAAAIARVGTLDDIPSLRGLFKELDRETARAAATAIVKIVSADGLPGLRALVTDVNWGVREALAGVLKECGAADALPVLRELLQDEDSDVREAAIEAVGCLGLEDCLHLLRTALGDPDWGVQTAAIRAIGKVGSSADIARLRSLLEDEEWMFRAAAAKSYGELASAADFDDLVNLTLDSERAVAQTALIALERLVDRFPELCTVARMKPLVLREEVDVSVLAANALARSASKNTLQQFVLEHQRRLPLRTLAVFDFYLYAPKFVRDAFERELSKAGNR